MPSEMTVRQSHDICLGLQDTIEAMREVERAFVHVDYVTRRYPEHKTERELLKRSQSVNDIPIESVPDTSSGGVVLDAMKAQSNASDDNNNDGADDDDAFGSVFSQNGSGSGGGGSGGGSDTTVRILDVEGGIEDPLLPPA